MFSSAEIFVWRNCGKITQKIDFSNSFRKDIRMGIMGWRKEWEDKYEREIEEDVNRAKSWAVHWWWEVECGEKNRYK